MNFDNIWCWLIPLLVGAICALLGYLWGKSKGEVIDNSAELKALKDKNAQLKADLDACNKKLTAAPKAEVPTSSFAASATPAIAFDAGAAKAAFGK